VCVPSAQSADIALAVQGFRPCLAGTGHVRSHRRFTRRRTARAPAAPPDADPRSAAARHPAPAHPRTRGPTADMAMAPAGSGTLVPLAPTGRGSIGADGAIGTLLTPSRGDVRMRTEHAPARIARGGRGRVPGHALAPIAADEVSAYQGTRAIVRTRWCVPERAPGRIARAGRGAYQGTHSRPSCADEGGAYQGAHSHRARRRWWCVPGHAPAPFARGRHGACQGTHSPFAHGRPGAYQGAHPRASRGWMRVRSRARTRALRAGRRGCVLGRAPVRSV